MCNTTRIKEIIDKIDEYVKDVQSAKNKLSQNLAELSKRITMLAAEKNTLVADNEQLMKQIEALGGNDEGVIDSNSKLQAHPNYEKVLHALSKICQWQTGIVETPTTVTVRKHTTFNLLTIRENVEVVDGIINYTDILQEGMNKKNVVYIINKDNLRLELIKFQANRFMI